MTFKAKTAKMKKYPRCEVKLRKNIPNSTVISKEKPQIQLQILT